MTLQVHSIPLASADCFDRYYWLSNYRIFTQSS